MPIFVSLVNFTEQGFRYIRHTTERADAFRAVAEGMGVIVRDIFWTQGMHDLIIIVEAPDDETVATLFFSVGSLGNIRAQTVRAFSADEMTRLLNAVA